MEQSTLPPAHYAPCKHIVLRASRFVQLNGEPRIPQRPLRTVQHCVELGGQSVQPYSAREEAEVARIPRFQGYVGTPYRQEQSAVAAECCRHRALQVPRRHQCNGQKALFGIRSGCAQHLKDV